MTKGFGIFLKGSAENTCIMSDPNIPTAPADQNAMMTYRAVQGSLPIYAIMEIIHEQTHPDVTPPGVSSYANILNTCHVPFTPVGDHTTGEFRTSVELPQEVFAQFESVGLGIIPVQRPDVYPS